MASDAEPAKQLLPYLQRADELQKHEPLVAYYCRLFAMEKGLKIPAKERTKTTNSLLVSLMNQLEKDKKAIKLSADDNLYIEGFASNVFSKADKQDRAGRADINTAKTFYAASLFFEIMTQFGELPPDIEQKLKYAIWKAADVRKALKEGRKPVPGPPGGEEDLSVPSSSELKADEPTPGQNISNRQSDGHSSPHVDRSDFQYQERKPASPPQPGSDYPPADFLPTPPSTRVVPDFLPTPPADFLPTPPSTRVVPGSYQQPYHYQMPPDQQNPPPPQNYPSYDGSPPNYPPHDPHATNYTHEATPHAPSISPYTLPNFQSYPSFTETSLPTAPSRYPSYHQGSDNAYPHQPPPTLNYPTTSQYSSEVSNTSHSPSPPPPPPAPTYTYDINYQPSVEKIAEAHKAARFAVGALAFDDVPVAVEFLRKSLELLTNPSAETH